MTRRASGRHQLLDEALAAPLLEREVALREEAREEARPRRLLDEDAARAVALDEAPHLGDRGAAREDERLLDDVGVARLDVLHARRLDVDRGAAVEEPEGPLEGERPRHLLADDGVHVRADDRKADAETRDERHRQVDGAPRGDRAQLGPEEEVVEGAAEEERFQLAHRRDCPSYGGRGGAGRGLRQRNVLQDERADEHVLRRLELHAEAPVGSGGIRTVREEGVAVRSACSRRALPYPAGRRTRTTRCDPSGPSP